MPLHPHPSMLTNLLFKDLQEIMKFIYQNVKYIFNLKQEAPQIGILNEDQ